MGELPLASWWYLKHGVLQHLTTLNPNPKVVPLDPSPKPWWYLKRGVLEHLLGGGQLAGQPLEQVRVFLVEAVGRAGRGG